ncbi:chorismate--pyruvate lyase family protein [Archaeoglobus neptunius]|uniref:chorismate--pyruvate lyase family protein n=1 Tax=Archaeoglobus neptunius TaxID=2798580 RepID=UPI001927F6CA|nr:chorismate pyruvate-lyase family protein [Archaeoglobus neptunius]
MNAIHRILMTTDGSITAIIEAIAQGKVEVRTVEQRIIPADDKISEILDVDVGEEVNYRVVYLEVNGEIYAKAISLTPIKRLEESFKDDLMKADIPIGKIMKKHRIEARREIRWAKVVNSNSRLARELGIKEGGKVIVRNYDIIMGGETLINITEYFPMEKFSL